jgi:hypothetical protein
MNEEDGAHIEGIGQESECSANFLGKQHVFRVKAGKGKEEEGFLAERDSKRRERLSRNVIAPKSLSICDIRALCTHTFSP